MTTEQIAASAEQSGNEPEPSQVAGGLAEAVAASGASAVAGFDLSTLEGIRAAAEANPQLRAWREEGYGAGLEAGKQRALRDVSLKQGTRESAQHYHERIVQETARRLEVGEPLDDLMKETPTFYTAALESIRVEAARSLYEQAKAINPDAVAALDGFADNPDLTAEQWEGISAAAMNAVANTSHGKGKQEWLDTESIDDIPKDSARWRALEAWHQKEIETEMTAQNIEQNRREVAPSTSPGTVADGIDLSRFEGMNETQAQAYMTNLALTNPVEYEKVKDALLTGAFGS